ncbi:aminotransferase family protein [Streptomyces sp. NPDC001142]
MTTTARDGLSPIAADLRRRDREHVWHTWSSIVADRSEPLFMRGRGSWLIDSEGRGFLDASSLNTTCGYGRPEITDAIAAQAARLQGVDISVLTHDVAGELAERLSTVLPDGLRRTLLVNSGSEGMEAAVQIALGYWGNIRQPRCRLVTLRDGYHGSTLLARSLSGLPRVQHDLTPPLRVTPVDLPATGAKLRQPAACAALLKSFETAVLGDPDDLPAAVVVEPFLNVGGGVVLPQGFLSGLRELCDRSGVLLVLDEVFTAYGRAGRMFAMDREVVAADVLVTSKGLTGGYLPLATVTAHERVVESFRNEPVIGGLRYGHTTSGHAVACSAALAVLDIVEREGLCERAERLGSALVDRLRPYVDAPQVADVRGLGLVVVVELDSQEASDALVASCRESGLLLRQPGRAVMLVPPLTVTDEEIEDIGGRFEAMLKVVVNA